MSHKNTIVSLWAAASLVIIGATGTALFSLHSSEANASHSVADLPVHQPATKSANHIKTVALGKQIIAKIYDDPSLLREEAVLGEQDPAPLSQEQVSDITTSTVIRVFNKITGTVSMPEFDVDFYNTKFIPNGRTYSQKMDSLSTGTGFFVDDQGHILTNSHVVDKHSVVESFTAGVLDYYSKLIVKQLDALSIDEQIKLREKIVAQYGGNPDTAALLLAQDLEGGITRYIDEKSKVDATQTITILDPQSQGAKIGSEEDLEKLVDKGFPATVVDWRPDYAKTHKDVAILKISNTPTPFLTLSNDKANTGQQIYIIGFPQNAAVDNSDLFSRTMTQGSINSIKTIDGTEIYQTDAKISLGSSGSPMINAKGEVIGIISFLTEGGPGDNFGYAVPIANAKDLMSTNHVDVGANSYMASFVEGVNLAAQNLCRKANAQFQTSQGFDQAFANPSLQKYVDQCNDKIAAGKSEDGKLYNLKVRVSSLPVFVWVSLVALVLISAGGTFFYRRYRHLQTAPAAFVAQ
jgi:S1-C subfamily serine protease